MGQQATLDISLQLQQSHTKIHLPNHATAYDYFTYRHNFTVADKATQFQSMQNMLYHLITALRRGDCIDELLKAQFIELMVALADEDNFFTLKCEIAEVIARAGLTWYDAMPFRKYPQFAIRYFYLEPLVMELKELIPTQGIDNENVRDYLVSEDATKIFPPYFSELSQAEFPAAQTYRNYRNLAAYFGTLPVADQSAYLCELFSIVYKSDLTFDLVAQALYLLVSKAKERVLNDESVVEWLNRFLSRAYRDQPGAFALIEHILELGDTTPGRLEAMRDNWAIISELWAVSNGSKQESPLMRPPIHPGEL